MVQTKGAVRLLRAYAEIGSRTTKYTLVVLAESLRNKHPTSVMRAAISALRCDEAADLFGPRENHVGPIAHHTGRHESRGLLL